MTDKRINAAIAEACGWKRVFHSCAFGILIGEHPHHKAYQPAPNFCNDLNAIHEAEEILSDLDYDLFLGSLIELCIVVGRERINSATARQRAEAFLRTIGKWEEVQP